MINLWELSGTWRRAAAARCALWRHPSPSCCSSAAPFSLHSPQLCALWLPEVSVKDRRRRIKTVLEKKKNQGNISIGRRAGREENNRVDFAKEPPQSVSGYFE